METHRYQRPTVTAHRASSAHPAAEAWSTQTEARFAALQQRLAGVLEAHRAGLPERTVVVVPSRTAEDSDVPAAMSQALEERLLCLLLALRDPGLSLVYVTSLPVPPETVEHCLSLLPAAVRDGARARLTLLCAHDDSPRPLTAKLLERRSLLTRIRWAIADRDRCHLVPYTTTALDRALALALDIPLHGPDPRHGHLGTKSGARALFARLGVPHPLGVEHVTGLVDAVAAIARMRAVDPGLAEVVVKHDDGVAGRGNALVDLRGLPAPGAAGERALILTRLRRMRLEAEDASLEAYLHRLAGGGIVEARIAGAEFRSPSAQLEIAPDGGVEVVSTHDQVLGGRSGQSYLGCRFPADAAYAGEVTELALRVGRELARAGVVGRCAIDFVAVRDGAGAWRLYAIELNLRRGGTTHPLAALELLTGGRYDAGAARFATPAGAERQYVATDHLEAPELRSLRPRDLVALAAAEPALAFDSARQVGVVLHMLSGLEIGRVGLTAIGASAADAARRFEAASDAILRAATAAAAPVAA